MSRSHPATRAASGAWPLAALLLGASFLAQGCSSKDDKEGEANVTVSVQAATAENATIQDKMSADAILYPRDQAAIVPRVNAPIKKFYVERGSKVHAGQLLAELEARDLAGAVTENQGGYEQAEASYNSAMQSARQDLNASKEQLDAAQKLFDSREILHKEGAMSAKDVEDSRIALTQARNQYDLAEKSYTLKAAQGQLTAAKGKTISAEAQLSYAKIVSPINGVVTDRPFYVGDTAPSGTAILTVMDLSKVVARAYISPQQAAELHVGDAASILPGNGESEIAGKVSVVSPALDPNSTTVQVWVEAPNPGGKLKSGSTVGLRILANTVKDALVVPAEAILTATDGTTSVMVIGKDGHAHQTPVKIGIRDDHDVQILSGLDAGQQVVTVGAYGLPDGSKVTITKPAAEPSGGTE
ncbi:MAG: efflux RND transporter periplasmic adaptor subunit [Candidatus Acidiferrales bacterium]